MPNHPHATNARSIAGKFAPSVPNDARANTGNGMPYFVPACALRIIGMSTMLLPSAIVPIACHTLMPCEIKLEASVYVVMHTAIPTQSAAMCQTFHVRWASDVGAMSAFQSGLPDKSPSTMCRPLTSLTVVCMSRLRQELNHLVVSLGTTIPVELPDVAYFANHIHVEIGHDDGILVARAFGDNLAARVGE